MKLSHHIFAFAAFCAAAGLSVLAANFSVRLIEQSSEIGVRAALDDRSFNWAEVQANGLTLTLAGIAPTEAARFAAISVAGTVVDAARVIDDMDVAAAAALAAPRFSAEILRNDAGLSIIGLIPAATDREDLLRRVGRTAQGAPVTELIETSDFPVPTGWSDAMQFALAAMPDLPRAKVSVEAGHVSVKAITDSVEEKNALEAKLNRAAPAGLRLTLEIAAPRPVITPFTLRFVKDDAGSRFDACSADTEETRAQIITTARQVGMTRETQCQVGMGVPSPNWVNAVTEAIRSLDEIGQGSVTFSNADITLIAAEGTDEGLFDRVVGELENDLPPVFALYAKLPETPDPNQGPPEFTATRSPEGLVQLRGRLPNENLREVADSYAKAAFGSRNVYTAARIVPDLPSDWAVRVLTGLEALAHLSNGAVRITPDSLSVTGNTGDESANSDIASLLASKLGEAEEFSIQVTYQEALDPVAALPTPQECIADIKTIQAESKISFEPGSTTIDASALDTMDDIAEILKECGPIRLEIQGHTDSQGREEMNQNLSQARAQSVLNELRARRVLTATYSAKGYGESSPIADNDSEEGREANRRIEFYLIRPAPSEPERETTLESVAASGDIEASQESDGSEGEGQASE